MNNQKTINIILANDQSLFRSAVKAYILQKCTYVSVVAEPENFPDLFKALLDNQKVDILVTDDVMPGQTILHALQQVRQDSPAVKIIVTTMHAHAEYVKSLIPFADGIVSYMSTGDIGTALETVLNGGIYYRYPGLVIHPEKT